MKNKKYKRFVVLAICLIVTCTVSVILVNQFIHPDLLIVNSNEQFPMLPTLLNSNDVSIFSENKSKVIIYVDSHCSVCIESIPQICELINIFSGDEYKIIALWEDKIPNNTKIPRISNISLQGKQRIAPSTPYMFIVDEMNIVRFSGQLNFNSLTQYLLKISNNDYRQMALEFIKQIMGEEMGSETNRGIVQFASSNCFACIEDQKKMAEYTMDKNVNTLIVTDNNQSIDGYYDPDILRNIFDIKYFPSYLIFDNDEWEIKNSI